MATIDKVSKQMAVAVTLIALGLLWFLFSHKSSIIAALGGEPMLDQPWYLAYNRPVLSGGSPVMPALSSGQSANQSRVDTLWPGFGNGVQM